MSKGSPYKLMIAFTIPTLMGNLIQQLYSVIDTLIVGKFLGVDALAALGVTGGFSFMVIGFAIGCGTGFGVIISQNFGAKDFKQMKKAFAMSIILSLIIGIILTLVFFLSSKQLLIMINTPANILDDANSYASIIYLGLLSSIFYNLFSSILKAVGDGKSPLYFLVISSILNIVFDLLFILVFNWGCEGVAIATILSQTISATISYIYISKNFPILKIGRTDFRLDIPIIKKLLKIGLPAALQFSVCAIGVIIVQIAINNFGSDYVAGYSIGIKVENLITQIFPALGMALGTFSAQNLGSKNLDRIKQGFLANFIMMVVCCAIAIFLTIYFAESLSKLFLPSNSATSTVLQTSVDYLNIISYFYFFLAMIFLFRTGCQGLGSGLIPMVSSILELVARTISAFTLPLYWGFKGLCFSSPVAWFCAGIILPFLFLWQIKQLKIQLEY